MPKSGSSVRVLYYLGYPHRMAGSQRSLLELIENLPPIIDPIIMLPDGGKVYEAYRRMGLNVHVMRPGEYLNRYGKEALQWGVFQKGRVALKEYFPYTWRLGRFIRENEIDLVHVNDPRAALLIGLASQLSSCPVVGHLRGEKPFDGLLWRLYESIPDRFITVSSAVQSSLSEKARRRSATVYNGSRDISHRGEPIPWLKSLKGAGVTIVCCFASVVPFKGYHHLLDAVYHLNKKGWKNKAVFLGIGHLTEDHSNYQEWLRRRRHQLGIDNFFFTGWQDDPFSFYRSADISVLPSVSREKLDIDGQIIEVKGNEGFPRTHLEAMSFGLPIVGTDIAGVSEQVKNGVTGFVVPPAHPEALADALNKLLASSDLRSAMGKAGKQRMKEFFSTESYVEGVMDAYKSLLPNLVQ